MRFKITTITIIFLLFSGCSTINYKSGNTETGELSGNWRGGWVSSSTDKEGAIEANFSHNDSVLSGTFSIKNSPCMSNGTVYGSVSGNKVKMLVRADGNTFDLNAYKNTNSNISGTYNITEGKCKGSTGKVFLSLSNESNDGGRIGSVVSIGDNQDSQLSNLTESVTDTLSDVWDNLSTQAGQNPWDTKLFRLGEMMQRMGTPYSQQGVSPAYRWMADEPNSGFDYSDYNRMVDQDRLDKKLDKIAEEIQNAKELGFISGNQLYNKNNDYMGYIKGSSIYSNSGQKIGNLNGRNMYRNDGSYFGYRY
jgi:hypothetical protein